MRKTCHICLADFSPSFRNDGRQIYCSSACALIGKESRRTYKSGHSLVKTCPKCKVKFSGKRMDARYCSKNCNKVTYKRTNKMRGNWTKAMERDEYKCRICSTPYDILVHHIDGTGERDNPNHDLGNLAVVCRSCHLKLHTLTFKIINGTLALDNPTYKLTGLLPIVWLDQVVTPTMEPYAIR